ncbi:MAG: PQQ-binding-like beta-propeller repeat protein, partial [Planctomycetaceae bacterium]|nr:PQQ-binding-like beta-propeller repeat protein [Planctomycetaceae bacterium]
MCRSVNVLLTGAIVSLLTASVSADWNQLQGNAQRSGDASAAEIASDVGLLAAIPTTDAIQAAPVVADGRIFVIDGSGVIFAIDALSHEVVWKHATRGGTGNCNNVAAPAVAGEYLHIGTMAGYYYVFEAATGRIVKEIDCQEPIFSAPAVGNQRVYFATLGARIYALEPNGTKVWDWDFVAEVVGFNGDR